MSDSVASKGATLSHLFYLSLYFMQRIVAQFLVETSQSAGLDRKMAGYLKELGYDVQEAQVPQAHGCAGAAGAGGEV